MSETPAQCAARRAKTPAQKNVAARMLELEAKGTKLGFYTPGWAKPSRPVVFLRTSDYVTYVRSIYGGGSFGVTNSEFSTYIPSSSKLATNKPRGVK